MNVTESSLYSDMIASYEVSIGKIFIFNNFIIAEYNEGLHLDFDSYSEVINAIDKHFGSRPFAFISNRINSYSLVLTDAPKFQQSLPNLIAYAVVYYSEISRKNVELEKRFYTFNRESFVDLDSAINWVKLELARKTEASI